VLAASSVGVSSRVEMWCKALHLVPAWWSVSLALGEVVVCMKEETKREGKEQANRPYVMSCCAMIAF